MSDTRTAPRTEPAETGFPYEPAGVPVTVQAADVAPHVRPRLDRWQAYADQAMTGWTTHE